MLYKEKNSSNSNIQANNDYQVVLCLHDSGLLIMKESKKNYINRKLQSFPYCLINLDKVVNPTVKFIPFYIPKVDKKNKNTKKNTQKKKTTKNNENEDKENHEEPQSNNTFEKMIKKFQQKHKKQAKKSHPSKPSKYSLNDEYYGQKVDELLKKVEAKNHIFSDDEPSINNNNNNKEDPKVLNDQFQVFEALSELISKKSDRRNRKKQKGMVERRNEAMENIKTKLNVEQVKYLVENILKLPIIGNHLTFQPSDIKKNNISQIEKKIKEWDEINKKDPNFMSIQQYNEKYNNDIKIQEENKNNQNNILSNSDLSDSLDESNSDDSD